MKMLQAPARSPAAACFRRGAMKKNRGDNAGAIVVLTEAIRLQPAHAQAHAICAATRADSGDAKGAKEDRERATALCPKKQYPEQ